MMKKIAFAAIGAGLAGSALAADTSVTLYGLLDMGLGYERVRAPGFNQNRIGTVQGVNSGSRFGLRGSEDLGDGLRAIFTLEGGITPLNGKSAQSGRLFGRQATVGLSDDSWGNLNSAARPTWRPSISAVRSIRSVARSTWPTWAPRSARRTPCAMTTWCCINRQTGRASSSAWAIRSTPTTPARRPRPEDGLRHRRQQPRADLRPALRQRPARAGRHL